MSEEEETFTRRRKAGVPRMEIVAEEIEKEHGRILTPRQKNFAKFYVEGRYSNKQCAINAGYAPDAAAQKARALLDPGQNAHVVEYVNELREERERQYGVTLIGQLQRFHELSRGAEDAGQFSAAVNAEKIRSALGGLTIDRRENINSIDQLSRDEIVARLAQLQKQFPSAFTIEGSMKDVTNGGTRSKAVDKIPRRATAEDVLDSDRE